MDEQQMLMKFFPHIVASCNLTSYNGFINVEGFDFLISLYVPSYPSLSKLSLQCSWMVSFLLGDYDLLLKEWVKNGTLYSFLKNLKKVMAMKMKKQPALHISSDDSILPLSFKSIVTDLNDIGFSNVAFSSSITTVILKMVDEANREHTIDVYLGKVYPMEHLQIKAVLPDIAVEKISKNTCLSDIYKSFVHQVLSLQYVWNVLDEIDCLCCVLDPEHPTRKDMGRRIMIEQNVSLYLFMNIENETVIPRITVLGPERAVQHHQSTLSRNLELWNPSNSVLDNIKLVLELNSLPLKVTREKEVSLFQEGECCICYSIKLDGKLPLEVCNDTQCASSFHTVCLFQWLQTIVGNYQSFNRIHGICPNCSTAISCPVPKYT